MSVQTIDPTDWNAVALGKLTKVLGAERGNRAMTEALRALTLDSLTSADDLYRFARHLAAGGGFVGAVGGLLSLHAVMHGARGAEPPSRR
jgi:hypothetical protein